jgi:tetratricopeptide (TPR) repeat protein
MTLAREAIAARDFDKAEGYLSNAKDPQGKRPKEVVELLDQARAERLMEKRLATARAALTGGKLDEADTALKESANTQAFATEHAALAAQLAEARKKAAAAAVPPAAPANGTTPTATQVPAAPSEAEKAMQDGRGYLKTKKYPRAVESLQKCVTLEPENAECHMFLGAALAGDNKSVKSVQHYRRFLDLAPPTHPRYDQVKSFIADYEKQQQPE